MAKTGTAKAHDDVSINRILTYPLIVILAIALFQLAILLPELIRSYLSGFEYITADKRSVIVGFRGVGDHIVIPDSLGGAPVTEIISLSYNRFDHNASYPGGYSFRCQQITGMTISKSISEIWFNWAFTDCLNLQNIEVDPHNLHFTSADGILCNKDLTSILCYPQGREDESFTIPSGISEVGSYAFARCRALKSVFMPDSVILVGEYAFSECSNLQTINLSAGLTEIRRGVFANCSDLVAVSIPQGAYFIAEYAFSGCGSLQTVFIPDSVTCIDEHAFDDCSGLTIYGLPGSEAERFARWKKIPFLEETVTADSRSNLLQELNLLNSSCTQSIGRR
ncbi:MAG: leucine-rich repeat domain-containing protein [Symbiobacteriaceae bacterium]|nr:leucine-rich repeat domain-containing protein [Symbiobacteriaceae bacterium]